MFILIPIGDKSSKVLLALPGTKEEVVKRLQCEYGEAQVSYTGEDVLVIEGKPFELKEGKWIYYTDSMKQARSVLG